MSEVQDFYDFESLYYDSIYGVFREDITFYKALSSRGPYLEIFAGTGRIISRFEGGIGLEINPNMLRNSSNRFIKIMGDARSLPFKKHFNTVIVGLNSLLLVTNEHKRTIVEEVRRVLNKGGLMFIDMINGFTLRKGTYNISDVNNDEFKISLKMKPRRFEDRYLLRYSYSISGRKKAKVEKEITIFPMTSRELQDMLSAENFELAGIFGDYDLSPLNKNSEKLIVRARAI